MVAQSAAWKVYKLAQRPVGLMGLLMVNLSAGQRERQKADLLVVMKIVKMAVERIGRVESIPDDPGKSLNDSSFLSE